MIIVLGTSFAGFEIAVAKEKGGRQSDRLLENKLRSPQRVNVRDVVHRRRGDDHHRNRLHQVGAVRAVALHLR